MQRFRWTMWRSLLWSRNIRKWTAKRSLIMGSEGAATGVGAGAAMVGMGGSSKAGSIQKVSIVQ